MFAKEEFMEGVISEKDFRKLLWLKHIPELRR